MPGCIDQKDWLADNIFISNDKLPPDFFRTVTSCTKDCSDCSYCNTLFSDLARKQPMHIKDRRHRLR